jgi:hypothetical protein
LGPDGAVVDLGEPRDTLGVSRREIGPNAYLLGQLVGIEWGLREILDDVERGGPGDLDRVHDLLANPLDDRRHGHHRRHADDDAQDRERRPELVGAERVERNADILGQRVGANGAKRPHDRTHSARRAAIGLRRAAREAG